MSKSKGAFARVLDKYGSSAVAEPPQPRKGYNGARRGDIVRVSSKATALGRRYVVANVSRIAGSGWGYDLLALQGREDSRLSTLSYTTSIRPLPALGRWTGAIAEGARGTVEPCTSDKAGTTSADQTNNAPAGRREAKMATVTRKGTKSSKPAKTKPAATAKVSKAKFAPTKAEVVAIAKRLREGAKMNEIKAEVGVSNGQPIRNALREHGFDSKGHTNPEGLTARELQAARRASGEEAVAGKPVAAKATKASAKTPRKRATVAKDPS